MAPIPVDIGLRVHVMPTWMSTWMRSPLAFQPQHNHNHDTSYMHMHMQELP